MRPSFIPYPPIERLGVIGDRRTAAMVAADGTICWWCLPDFDGCTVFATLLDAAAGGYCRLGPAEPSLGAQHSLQDTAALVTCWDWNGGCLELTDVMLSPETSRQARAVDRRTVLRRLRCLSGSFDCVGSIVPRPDFGAPAAIEPDGFQLDAGELRLTIWSSFALDRNNSGFAGESRLIAGDEVWLILDFAEHPSEWSTERACTALAETIDYWRRWSGRLQCEGTRSALIKQSALLVHLLSYAPSGAPIAAPTASLPERVGGDRNFDYRFSWIRDASLSLSLLAELGFTGDEERYLDWLAALPPGRKMPLQTAYRTNGGTEGQVSLRDLDGYRQSRPVRFGNPALDMLEIGSFGYLADCIWTYVERDGRWKAEYWELLRRIAEFVAEHWRQPDAGIWELERRHFVSSRVLSWVVLDRVIKIADRVGQQGMPRDRWRREMEAIRAEVMSYGWSERLQSFRQHYDADTVDAALLLMPLLGFLAPDHPRVKSTVAQIEKSLVLNGFVYRFVEEKFPGQGELPLGQEEGAFAMCTCWLAHYYVRRGDLRRADEILRRVEATAPVGLLAEAIDGRTGALLGNMPLLFSQAEYAKAALALTNAEAAERGAGG